jgi:nucleotide-binding universal stress UspA family protein
MSANRRVVVGVDGSPDSAAALQRAASQARQRNATLDVVCVIPGDADARAAALARALLGEFTRRECPYGIGAPVRLRVERGDPAVVMPLVSADAELLVTSPAARPGAGWAWPPGQVSG